MKKIVSSLFLLSFCVVSFSQEKKSEVSNLVGAQIGFHSVDLYGEYKVSNTITVKGSVYLSGYYSNGAFSLIPAASLSPKWYYNIEKRSSEGKNTLNNSANYLALDVNYTPNWFTISKVEVNRHDFFQVLPTWGLRRNISNNFNYEVSAGVGYESNLTKKDSHVGVDITLKLDYTF